MPSLSTTLHVTAGYETIDVDGVHPNWQITTLLYTQVLYPRWGLPSPHAFSRLCKTGSLNRAARKHENVLSLSYGPLYSQGDARARGMLCQFALHRPDVRLALFFDYQRQDAAGSHVLGWVDIICEHDLPAEQFELCTQLYEAISALATEHGIHLHNEEGHLSSTVTITVSEQRACYRSWHDEAGRGPAEALSVGGVARGLNETEESGT